MLAHFMQHMKQYLEMKKITTKENHDTSKNQNAEMDAEQENSKVFNLVVVHICNTVFAKNRGDVSN